MRKELWSVRVRPLVFSCISRRLKTPSQHTPRHTRLKSSNPFEGKVLSDGFRSRPIHSHRSKPHPTSRYHQPLSSEPSRSSRRQSAGGMFLCNICGIKYSQPQRVTRHYREVHESQVLFFIAISSGVAATSIRTTSRSIIPTSVKSAPCYNML